MANSADLAKSVNRALSSDVVLEQYIKRFTGGLTVMPNNICNAKCVCCPYPFHTDKKTTLPLDAFRRALDSAFQAGYVGTIQFTPMAGEPLADPTLFDKIAYAKQKGVQVIMFSTNGILLGYRENYKKLVDSNITQVHVSSPGFDPEHYKKIFGVDKCDELVDGLHLLAQYKRSKGAKSTTVIEVSVMLSLPLKELLELRGWKLLRPYFDDGTLKIAYHESVEAMLKYHYPPGQEHISPVGTEPTPGVVSNYVDNFSGSVTEDMLPPGWAPKPVTHSTSDIPCWRLLEDVAILPEGKVRLCSCRYKGTAHDELVIGDTAEQPIAEIVYGDKHKELIRNVAAGHWPEVCAKCSMYQPATFTPEEAEFLESVALDDRTNEPQTYPINSAESYRLRAEAKLKLGAAAADAARAANHFQGALSYAGAYHAQRPGDAGAINLFERAQAAVRETSS